MGPTPPPPPHPAAHSLLEDSQWWLGAHLGDHSTAHGHCRMRRLSPAGLPHTQSLGSRRPRASQARWPGKPRGATASSKCSFEGPMHVITKTEKTRGSAPHN